MPKRIEITEGDIFNKLTFLYEVPKTKNARMGMFKCTCGVTKVMDINAVRSGRYTGCGCNQIISRHRHGYCTGGESSLYKRWCAMKYRCDNPNSADYHRYGGRGITICAEWYGFKVFAQWAKDSGYVEHLTIDRRDNDKGYSPSNCRWVGQYVQAANKTKMRGTANRFTGVRQLPSGNWQALITHKGKKVYLGAYPTEDEAVAVRNAYIKQHSLPHQLANKEIVEM